MRKLSRFEKFGLMAAVIIACTFFYVKKVYEPQEARLKKTIATLNKVVGQINNLKDVPPAASVKRSLKRYRQDLEELSEQLKGTQMHTGAEREVTKLLSTINGKLARNGLQVNSLTPEGTTTDELLQWNMFAMDLEGSFQGFLNFVQDLKNLKDAVKIEKVQMEKGEHRRLHIQLNLMI
jgi:Tfp pilus assembly protein PilO